MSKLSKIGMALGGSIIFLLVSLSILVRVVVTPEKVRETLIPLAEKSLERKIEVGAINIGIFSGVSLADLRVQKKKTPDDFITVSLVALKYEILPLFYGEIVINHVLLEEPRIHVVRNADGRFNFDDLLDSGSEKTVNPDIAVSTDEKKSTTSAFNLLIKKVSVTGGDVLFVDRFQNSKSPYRYLLNQIQFEADQLTLDNAFPLKFSASLNDSRIDLSGHYDISTQSGDIDLQLSALDVVKFSPYFRDAVPGKLASGVLSLNLEVQFDKAAIESKGKVALEQLDMVFDDFPDAAFQHSALGLDYALNYSLEKRQLDLSTLLIQLNDTALRAEGRVAFSDSDPVLQLALLFDQLDLRGLFESLPQSLTKELQDYSLAGKIDGRVALKGVLNSGLELFDSADLKLAGVQMTLDRLRMGVDGSISYRNKIATAEKLSLNVADQQASLDFKFEDLFEDISKGEFRLSAQNFNVDQLLLNNANQAVARAKDTQPGADIQSLAGEIGPFDLPVDLHGTLQLGLLTYHKMVFEQVHADLFLKNNQLTISSLQAGVAGGKFNSNAEVNLGVKGLQYRGQMALDQSNLLSLVSGVLPQAQQSVSGLLQWQNNFSGRGTLPDKLLHALQLNGVLQVRQGEVAGSPLLEQLALVLDLPELKILSFDSIESHYDLRDGLVNLSGLLNSSKVKLTPKGTVGLDGALNLNLDARVAPQLMDKIGDKTGLKRVVSDKDGWGILPLVLKGSFSNPRVDFDSAALQQQAADKLKAEATQRLVDKILPQEGTEQDSVKQLLEGTLNRLFGK